MEYSVTSTWPDTEVAATGAQTFTKEQVDATYRKVTLRLIPFLFFSWVLNYIDRVNVSFAKIPMTKDLGMTDAAYGLGIGLFFIGYILFEVPSNLLMQRIGARKTIMRIMVLWGVVSALMMFVTTPAQFYGARILLGAAEAGFYPGIILYLTYWFPSARRARITSRFLLAIAVSGMIGGPISGWILHNLGGLMGLKNWQWLFLMEGIPSVLAGIFAYFWLVDRPEQASWLTADEKWIVLNEVEADEKYKQATKEHTFLRALRDPRVYIAVAGYSVVPLIGTVLNYWTPSIIKHSGVSNIWHIGLLSAIPFLVGATAMFINARHSDRTLERRWHFAFATLIGALGCILLPAVANNWVLAICCLALVGIGYFCGTGSFWTIPPAYFSGAASAGGIALISSMGQFGSMFAPMLLGWLKTHTGDIATGLYIIAGIVLLGGAIIVIGIPAQALRERKAE